MHARNLAWSICQRRKTGALFTQSSSCGFCADAVCRRGVLAAQTASATMTRRPRARRARCRICLPCGWTPSTRPAARRWLTSPATAARCHPTPPPAATQVPVSAKLTLAEICAAASCVFNFKRGTSRRLCAATTSADVKADDVRILSLALPKIGGGFVSRATSVTMVEPVPCMAAAGGISFMRRAEALPPRRDPVQVRERDAGPG